jgi:hypothetical protein
VGVVEVHQVGEHLPQRLGLRAVSIQRVPDDIVVIVTSVPLTRRMLSCRGGQTDSTVDILLTPSPCTYTPRGV